MYAPHPARYADATGRLVSAVDSASNGFGSLGYSYDKNGNRTVETRNASNLSYVYNPDVISQVEHHFDAQELSKADAEEMRPTLAAYLGLALSMYNSLRCVLYHGCFLNELIERVRADNDKALFDAIRVDPTVIGCPSVSTRISKAALLRDDDFFDKLKAAINGTLAKRDQANFQKMRLVLEILHEAGATRLSDAQLHELFVEELKLYSGHAEGGGSAKALRKFCDTYMKKSATT